MRKKLKIQFWRAEKALAMQILEQEGLPERKGDGFVRIYEYPFMHKEAIELRGYISSMDRKIPDRPFNTNTERDAFLKKVVNAITDELFTGEGKLKVGEICEVRDGVEEEWRRRKLITILPEKYNDRYIAEVESRPTGHFAWKYARPITKRTEPKIEECGQLITYTWEGE